MKNLVTNGFKRYAIDKLVAKVQYIHQQMSEHEDVFPSPEPSLAELSKLAEELIAAQQAAESKDRIKLALLRDKKMEVVDFLQDLGMFVNVKSRGQRSIALRSGFDIVKKKGPRVLAKVGTPIAKRGKTLGNIETKVKAQRGATGYTWYITDDDKKPLREWEQFKNEWSSAVLTGRKPGVLYFVCAEIQGARKQLMVSPTAMVVA